MTYCPHDDDPNSCPPCQRALRSTEPLDIGPVFPARFQGWCPDCGDEFNPSDELRMINGVPYCRGCADHLERYG